MRSSKMQLGTCPVKVGSIKDMKYLTCNKILNNSVIYPTLQAIVTLNTKFTFTGFLPADLSQHNFPFCLIP